MFNKLQGISPMRWVTYALFTLSMVFLAMSILMVANIQVLTSWTLELPNQKIHVGDEIVVKSIYTKVRNATGESVRSLDCKDSNGLYLRYDLNRKVANRAPRSGGTGIQVIIPDVPNTPTTCKVSVAITYHVFKIGSINIYDVPESNETKEFTLYPAAKESTPTTSSTGASQKTTQSPAVALNERGQASGPVASSSQSTPKSETPPTNTSQESSTPAPVTGTPVIPPCKIGLSGLCIVR